LTDEFGKQFVLLETKKPACPLGDIDDVTLGSPAVFYSIALMTDPVTSAKQKTRGFPPPFHKGFGLEKESPLTLARSAHKGA
jgi:hypothetical protein